MAPGKPSAAPTVSRSGRTFTITSAVSTGAKVYLLLSRIQNSDGTWPAWVAPLWPMGKMDGRKTTTTLNNGSTIQVRTCGGSSDGSNFTWGDLGTWSDVTMATMPSAPSVTPSVSIVKVSTTSVKASWGSAPANGAAIQSYKVELFGPGDVFPRETKTTSGAARSVSFTGIGPGGIWRVNVRAVNEIGAGPIASSGSVNIGGIPATISTVALSTAAVASWSAPANNGEAITRYEAQVWNGTAWGATQNLGTTRSYTIPSPSPGIGYKVRARAVNAIGAGAWRESATVQFNTAPSTISTVTLTRALVATWTAPADGGSAITRYEIQVWDGYTWGPTINRAKNLNYTIPNALAGAGYKVRARAVNTIGAGTWRESSPATSSACVCV